MPLELISLFEEGEQVSHAGRPAALGRLFLKNPID